ncbi:MAG TPA: ABC transporter ATP-binding protein [Gammaproteobacteria bacterium]|nr:ABC transporter ATP-binding protein [Gammaproteobacteria bacterium]
MLSEINLTVEAGETLCIMGASGSGKSTLLHILGLLDTPSSGTYIFNNQNLRLMSKKEKNILRNKNIGFLFQSYHLLKGWSVLDNITLPLLYRNVPLHEARHTAKTLLTHMNLTDLMNQKTQVLSGGQKQRVALARTLSIQPKLLLLDEPTGALDYENAQCMMKLVFDLQVLWGFTLVMVSHDPTYANYCNKSFQLLAPLCN